MLTEICITDSICIMHTEKNKVMLLEDIYHLKDKVLRPEDSLKMWEECGHAKLIPGIPKLLFLIWVRRHKQELAQALVTCRSLLVSSSLFNNTLCEGVLRLSDWKFVQMLYAVYCLSYVCYWRKAQLLGVALDGDTGLLTFGTSCSTTTSMFDNWASCWASRHSSSKALCSFSSCPCPGEVPVGDLLEVW